MFIEYRIMDYHRISFYLYVDIFIVKTFKLAKRSLIYDCVSFTMYNCIWYHEMAEAIIMNYDSSKMLFHDLIPKF